MAYKGSFKGETPAQERTLLTSEMKCSLEE